MVRTIIWGLIVAGIGVWLWLSNLGIIRPICLRRDWPLIIVMIGLLTIGEGISRYLRSRK
ncbi:MAG: DUF5668 domain-containing protein [candidate division WOR-3 bacterium]